MYVWVYVFVQTPRMNRHLGKPGQNIIEIDIRYTVFFLNI